MRTDSQAFAVLSAISVHAPLFSAKPELIHKAARDIVLTQIKHKSTQLDVLRAIGDAIGRESFSAIIEEIPTTGLKTLVAKFDKSRADQAKDGHWARTHLSALAFREADPAAPTPKKAGTSKNKRSQPGDENLPVRLLHQSKALARRR